MIYYLTILSSIIYIFYIYTKKYILITLSFIHLLLLLLLCFNI